MNFNWFTMLFIGNLILMIFVFVWFQKLNQMRSSLGYWTEEIGNQM